MAHQQKNLGRYWRKLGITRKFTLAFGLLLALIVLGAVTSFVALTTVRSQTETDIVTSTHIRCLALKMQANLEKARHLEKSFFLRYPQVGFSEAQQTFVQRTDEHISQAMALSIELQDLISRPNVSADLRESDVNLNLYLSAAERHAATFEQAVELVATLATDETGLQARLEQTSASLHDVLHIADDPNLRVFYHEMRSLEKDYLVTRQRPFMQSAFNIAISLREEIELAPALDASQKTQAIAYLDAYRALADEILALDLAIKSTLDEFDLQAQTIDPVSEDLILLADREVERARERIGHASWLTTVILAATALTGLALTVTVALVLHNSVTRNVVKLTKVAGEWQAGNMEQRAQVDSADELGQLAESFNAMAARINTLVGNLEQKVTERTAELMQAVAQAKQLNEQLQAALAEKEVLLREIHHRVKNNLQALIYLIDMQTEVVEDPQGLWALAALQGRARAMSIVHEKLYQAQDLTRVDFGDYLQDLVAHLFHALEAGRDISLRVDTDDIFINVDIAIPCGLIVNELVTNALKHAFPAPPGLLSSPPVSAALCIAARCRTNRPQTGENEGGPEIRVEFGMRGGEYVLVVADNGVGMLPELDWRATESLGLKLVNVWATHQLGGSIELNGQHGATFTIKFADRKRGG